MSDQQTKTQLEDLAKYAEEQAEVALERAVKFSAAHGVQSCLNDLVMTGALLCAVAVLRERAGKQP